MKLTEEQLKNLKDKLADPATPAEEFDECLRRLRAIEG